MARQRMPTATLSSEKFQTGILGFDLSELLAVVVLGVVFPLLMFGRELPLPLWIANMAVWPLWAVLLFFVKREGRNTAEWLTTLIPFWKRQHTFRPRHKAKLPSAWADYLDRSTVAGANLVSWRWQTGSDGLAEIHVFEEPLRPYRAIIARTAPTRVTTNKGSQLVPARAYLSRPPIVEQIAEMA